MVLIVQTDCDKDELDELLNAMILNDQDVNFMEECNALQVGILSIKARLLRQYLHIGMMMDDLSDQKWS